MNKVESLQDLKREKKRLLHRSRELESVMKKDLKELKYEIDQTHLTSKVVRNLITGNGDGLALGSGLLIEFFISRVFFKRSNFITRHAMTALAQHAANNFLSDKKAQVVSWLGTLWQKAETKEIFHLGEKSSAKKETELKNNSKKS